MKKIFTLVASMVLTASVFAAESPKSVLTIKSASQADLKVVVDGRRYEPNHNSVMIDGLDAGAHTVKILQKTTGLSSILGKQFKVIYDGSVITKPRSIVTISIDRAGTATVSKARQADWDNDSNYGNADNNYGSGQWGGYDNHYGYSAGMNDAEFKAVLKSIDKEWLESNKMKSATQVVSNNALTAAQVKELVLKFSIETNKLDLAKQAYRNTVDKENYDMIYSAFSFTSSKNELARFIRTSR